MEMGIDLVAASSTLLSCITARLLLLLLLEGRCMSLTGDELLDIKWVAGGWQLALLLLGHASSPSDTSSPPSDGVGERRRFSMPLSGTYCCVLLDDGDGCSLRRAAMAVTTLESVLSHVCHCCGCAGFVGWGKRCMIVISSTSSTHSRLASASINHQQSASRFHQHSILCLSTD